MDPNESLRYLNVGLPETILRMKLCGRFDDALRAIDKKLADPALPFAMRQCLTAERHIIGRTPREYPYTKAEALAKLQKLVPDFTEEDLQERMDSGFARWVYVNGEEHLIESFEDTLTGRDPVFMAATEGSKDSGERKKYFDLIEQSIEKMRATGSHSVRVRIRATIRLKDEEFRKGMFLRVHLPVAAACKQQSDIVIEKLYPENGMVAPEDAPQRTVCWEETMEENHEFSVEYSYTHTALYHDTEHLAAAPQEHNFCVEEEEPHIVFTPYVRYLAKTLAEGVTDPLEKAWRFYDFITSTMHYAFEPPYVLLECIADHLALGSYADCGVFAILFISLCRCAGIPAQWQSGLVASPARSGNHDWAQFYVEPYGWLFADCSFGAASFAAGNEKRRRFFFGNLDPYRMVANRCFQQNFTVPKQQWRSDPYDNQNGEMETTDRGFYRHHVETTAEVVAFEEL